MLDRVHVEGGAFQEPALDRKAHDHVGQLRQRFCRRGRRLRRAVADARHGGQQVAGIGLRRRAEQGRGRGLFHLAARLHHDHAVGHFGHDAHVVGDQDDRGAKLALQVAQQVQHLALNGHVQRGGGFVGDQHLGAQRQRHGDHHALPHAARKFMRVLQHPPFRLRQPDRGQCRQRPLPGLGAADIGMRADRLGQLGAHGQDRVQAGHRFLEDHGDAVAADAAQLCLGGGGQVGRAQPDAARRHAHGRRRQKAHDRQRGDRLARAAFPGNGQRLAAVQREGQLLHQGLQAGLGADRNRQPFHRQHGEGVRGRRGPGQVCPPFRHSKTQRGK